MVISIFGLLNNFCAFAYVLVHYLVTFDFKVLEIDNNFKIKDMQDRSTSYFKFFIPLSE